MRNSRTKQELSNNDFKSVKWTVKDGASIASGTEEFIVHEFACVGKADISANMVCKHCGKMLTASISRPVMNRPISVAFKFDPDKDVFNPGSTIKILDKSTGRVKGENGLLMAWLSQMMPRRSRSSCLGSLVNEGLILRFAIQKAWDF